MKFSELVIIWSEVWAFLIPLIIILLHKPKGRYVNLLIIYIISGFILNFCAIFTLVYPERVPSFLMYNNNIFYNIHSFIMVIFLGLYIIRVRPYKYLSLLKTLIWAYILFVLANFIFFERPLIYSTRLFTIGSIILLILCLLYFITSIREESDINWLKHPSFIICSGISLYHGITFFIFLFLRPMFNSSYNNDPSFADLMMKITQGTFLLYCILLAIGLYQYRYRKI